MQIASSFKEVKEYFEENKTQIDIFLNPNSVTIYHKNATDIYKTLLEKAENLEDLHYGINLLKLQNIEIDRSCITLNPQAKN
jgi:hypothetical protein